jgi:preprotein translocase subunit SecD
MCRTDTRRSFFVPPSAGTLRVGRHFAVLFALLVVLYAIVFWPGQRHTPKLGLDLEGGAQVTLVAQTPDGKTPSKASMRTAQSIIEQRVNGLGVSAATVQIQGSDRIVVSVPGKSGDSIKDIGRPFTLNFRPAILEPVAVTSTATPSASASASASGSASASTTKSKSGTATAKPSASSSKSASASASVSPLGRVVPHLAGGSATPSASSANASATASASTSASPSASASASSTSGSSGFIDQWKSLGFTPPKDLAAYNKLTTAQQTAVQAVVSAWQCSTTVKPIDDVNKPLVACDTASANKYLLGAVIVQGKEIRSATALAPGSVSGQTSWAINLSLKTTGQKQWADYTSAHNAAKDSTDVAALVAYTLDSEVTEAATISETITGDTQITGTFTASQAQNFANSLKYGALPLSFQTPQAQSISATLGSSQLKSGLLAGGIGLFLVVIYSLIYYRALGLVTVASLLVSGGMTYAMLVILGEQIGFTLTLAGIAGFIVAVGITADSFVVFFERIKDEVHEGRTSRVAIPRAWERARRTILSADAVSFLAAATLYYFAAGDVKGFAFTLGLSTVLDLVVVFLFTHPIVSLFSRSAAFGSARFTGLDHVRVGGIASYRSSSKGRRSASSTGAGMGMAEPETEAPAATQDVLEAEAATDDSAEESVSTGAGVRRRGANVNVGSTAAERAAARRAAKQPDGNAGQGENL